MLLIFGGPTYVPYANVQTQHRLTTASVVVGAVLFIVGIIFMIFLSQKESNYTVSFASDTLGCIIKSAN